MTLNTYSVAGSNVPWATALIRCARHVNPIRIPKTGETGSFEAWVSKTACVPFEHCPFLSPKYSRGTPSIEGTEAVGEGFPVVVGEVEAIGEGFC
jgi:hypothetical protein